MLLLLIPKLLVKTKRQLSDLMLDVYITAGASTIVFLVLAIVIASSIRYTDARGAGRDKAKRRLWFYLLAFLQLFPLLLISLLWIAKKIPRLPLREEFWQNIGITSAVMLLAYLLLGFILAKLMNRSKFATVF
jgi:hypothetical protein